MHDALTLYVPQAGSYLEDHIKAGAAMLGSPAKEWLEAKYGEWVITADPLEDTANSKLMIDFEGNIYGAENMRTYADRVEHAAGRHRDHAPTIARLVVAREDLIAVGSYDGERIETQNSEALASWLGGDYLDDAELERTPRPLSARQAQAMTIASRHAAAAGRRRR